MSCNYYLSNDVAFSNNIFGSLPWEKGDDSCQPYSDRDSLNNSQGENERVGKQRSVRYS